MFASWGNPAQSGQKVCGICYQYEVKPNISFPQGIPPQYSNHSEETNIINLPRTLFPNTLDDQPSNHQLLNSVGPIPEYESVPGPSGTDQPPPYGARSPLQHLGSFTNIFTSSSSIVSNPESGPHELIGRQAPYTSRETDSTRTSTPNCSTHNKIFPKGMFFRSAPYNQAKHFFFQQEHTHFQYA